jgi:Taurine catabolism dioxygenase TauD, TfdA family
MRHRASRRPCKLVKRHRSRRGNIEALHRTFGCEHHGLVAGLARQATQPRTFSPQNDSDPPARKRRAGESSTGPNIQTKRPNIRGFQCNQRAGDVDRAQQRNDFKRSRSGLRERASLLRRVAVLGDHAGGSECGGRAQDGTHVPRVSDLVEHDDRARAFQQVRKAGLGQRVSKQRRALMGGVAAEQMVHAAAIRAFRRQRPRRRQALGELGFRLVCQQQAAEAARVVGKRGSDGVQAIQPDGATRGLGQPRARAMFVARTGTARIRARPGRRAVARASVLRAAGAAARAMVTRGFHWNGYNLWLRWCEEGKATMGRQLIEGSAVWRGSELETTGDWIRTLDDGQVAEVETALRAIERARFARCGFGRADFPLDRLAGLLAEVSMELEDGRGAVRLRGLPTERYTEEQLRQIFWGIGQYLGAPLFQNRSGEIMGEVRDETRDECPSYLATEPGKVVSSRARARSTGPLRFHTDRCDVIALFCIKNGIAGGVSKLASIPMIHNEMLRRRPDLLEELFHDYWRARPADEDGAHEQKAFALPVFGMRNGRITSQYSRTYVEQAQEFSSVPRLTEKQDEALDLLAEIAEEICLYSAFEPGDIQLLNNHVVYHGRTAYEDDIASGRSRLLLRLWLSVPNSRALPEGFEVLWGSAAPGALRGGVVQADDRRGWVKALEPASAKV